MHEWHAVEDQERQATGYGDHTPDSFNLFLPLPPSSSKMPPTPFPTKEHHAPPQLRPRFTVPLSPRPLCYPSPRVMSDRTCSSSDAVGDLRAAPHPACVSAARSALETAESSCVAAADSSRKTLVHTAATTAPSETGALYSSTPVPARVATPPPAKEDASLQDNVDSSNAEADPTPARDVRSNDTDDREASLPCPRSPAGSTHSSASGSAAGSYSAAGVAAVLPTPPATPGNSYAGADEIFDVGQLCRRLSHCAAGEVVALGHRSLHPPTASWPVALHDHGPIIPHCGSVARGERTARARCDLRATSGIVACMSGTRAVVRDAILNIGAEACILLDESCGDVRFEDVCFQGGAIVCRGRGCRLTLTRVDLQMCAIIALHGAQVWLHDTSATAAEDGIGVFACGTGTAVHAEQLTLTEGLLGVSVQGGSRFSGTLVTITGAAVAGVHACGTGSYVHIKKGHVYDLGQPAQDQGPTPSQGSGAGALISQGAVGCFEDMAFERCESGVEIRSRGRGTLKNCRVHGCSGSAVVVEDAGAELFDCAMDGCCGYGMFLQRGADAEAHGCSFARSTLNGVYIQEGSEAVLRWCTLEQSGLWSGLEVEGHGSTAECHSCIFLRNQHCGVFVHSGAAADLGACESEGNGMSGYRVHGRSARLKLDGCCSKDVVAYQRHHHGVLECVECSPGGQMMADVVRDDGSDRVSTGEVAPEAFGRAARECDSEEVGQRPKQKRGLFRALVRAMDRKRH